MRLIHRGLHATCQSNVILLQQDRVVKPDTVVRSAAHLHRVLLQQPQPGRGLSRVAYLGARSGKLFDEAARQCGDPAQPPQKIQRRPLTRKNCPRSPRKLRQHLAALYNLPLLDAQFHVHLRIKPLKDLFHQRQSRANQFLLRQYACLTRSLCRNRSRDGHVARPNILRQSPLNHFRNVFRIPIHQTSPLGRTMSIFDSSLPPELSSRPERPDFFLRAALWRVGPRSRGIAATSHPRSPLRFLHSYTLSLLYFCSPLFLPLCPLCSSLCELCVTVPLSFLHPIWFHLLHSPNCFNRSPIFLNSTRCSARAASIC